MICHPNECLNEKECSVKVNLKCKCKTLKKSLQCNQIKLETDLIEFKHKENKYYLKCNEKCAEKKLKQDNEINLNKEEQSIKKSFTSNESSLSLKLIIFAFVILFVSIIVYFIF